MRFFVIGGIRLLLSLSCSDKPQLFIQDLESLFHHPSASGNLICSFKLWVSAHFCLRYCALTVTHTFGFFPLLCSLLLFSRSMRDKDTSALREMFQYSSLTEKPFDQWEIATHLRAFQIQDKSRHGEDWGRNPPKKCFCISLEGMVWLNDLFCWGQLMVSLQTVAHTFVRLSHQIITWRSLNLQVWGGSSWG